MGTKIHKESYSFFDSDTLSEALDGGNFKVEQLDTGYFQADLTTIDLGSSMIDKGHYTRSVLFKGQFDPDFLTLGFNLHSKQASIINGLPFKDNDLMIFEEGEDVDYVAAADTIWSTFQCREDDLRRMGVVTEKLHTLYHFDNVQLETKMQLQAFFHDIENNQRYYTDAMIYNHVLSIYAKALTYKTDGKHIKQQESLHFAKKIYTYIKDHSHHAIQMIELTELIGMSERTVERIFKKHFGVTPYSYLKFHRLNLIRKELLYCSSEKPHITRIATKYGFTHIAYFGQEYKKLFGETPSQTVQRR